MHDPHGAHGLYDQVVHFIGIGASADESDGLAAVNGVALCVFLDEGLVASLLDFLTDFVDRIVPGDVFPVRATGPPYLRLEQAALVHDVLLERSAFGAKRATVD